MRLRTWARENYVPREDREQDWHPVVLEEMVSRTKKSSRESDNAESDSRGEVTCGRIVARPHATINSRNEQFCNPPITPGVFVGSMFGYDWRWPAERVPVRAQGVGLANGKTAA